MTILRRLFCLAFLLCALNLSAAERFVLLADVHVSPGNANDTQLNKAVMEINRENYNFAIIAGDLTNVGSQAELENVSCIFALLKLPWYVVPGNHETNWSPSAGRDYAQLFGDTTPVFRNKDMLFFGFDCGPFMRMGNGVVPPDNLVDIDRKLELINKKHCNVFAFGHYPLDAGELSNAPHVINYLRKHKVRAYFCGHHHFLKLRNFGGMPTLFARSLWNGKNFGYNIVEIEGEEIRIFDKVIDQPLGKPVITFKMAEDMSDKVMPVVQPTIPENSGLIQEVDMPVMIQTAASEMDGILYFGTARGDMIAWSLKQKRQLWKRSFNGPVYSRPCLTQDLVAFGTTDNRVVALNRHNGKTVWEQPAVSPVVADGTIHGNALYIGLGTKEFAKFDLATGRKLWSITGVAAYMQGAPDIDQGVVVFGAWDRTLRCLDANTGKLIWKWTNPHRAKLYSPGNTTPKIVGNQVMFVAPDRKLTALDLKTGKEIYRLPYKKVRESFTAAEDRKSVYAKTMDGVLLKLAAGQSKVTELWATDLNWGYELNPCPPLEYKGVVYVAGHQGQMAALDANTGAIIWNGRIGCSAVNRLTVGDKGIYALLLEGKIWRISK